MVNEGPLVYKALFELLLVLYHEFSNQSGALLCAKICSCNYKPRAAGKTMEVAPFILFATLEKVFIPPTEVSISQVIYCNQAIFSFFVSLWSK